MQSHQASQSKETANLSQEANSNLISESFLPCSPSPTSDVTIPTCHSNQWIPAWHRPINPWQPFLAPGGQGHKIICLFARLYFKPSLSPVLCFSATEQHKKQRGGRKVWMQQCWQNGCISKAFINGYLHPKGSKYPMPTHFRQPYLDVPGSRVTTKESRGNLTLPIIPESMHGMLFSPGLQLIYSQERDDGRQSLAMKGEVSAQDFAKQLSSVTHGLSPSSWLLSWQSQVQSLLGLTPSKPSAVTACLCSERKANFCAVVFKIRVQVQPESNPRLTPLIWEVKFLQQ